MTNGKNKKEFDLEERTAKFGEEVIRFAQTISKNEITKPLIGQFVRSSTSIGANYMEADGAESRKDFIHKLGICKKECKETKHWLRMIATADPVAKDKCQNLWRECQELTLIFSAIINKTKEPKV
ncbi:MAG TPA: four helix bundle protein [Candidatus Moranbacteria bacterium]|nr:four helix bundle protein [Candidatus Moranbacteria bacterium]HSA08505.1 four helix bundle protein [Candidatus Moranbacteria bacterium]